MPKRVPPWKPPQGREPLSEAAFALFCVAVFVLVKLGMPRAKLEEKIRLAFRLQKDRQHRLIMEILRRPDAIPSRASLARSLPNPHSEEAATQMAKRALRVARRELSAMQELPRVELESVRIENIPGLPPAVAKAFAYMVRHAVASWLLEERTEGGDTEGG